MSPFDLLPFALLGALLGLDVVSFPQAMLSRPLVAATLAGALAGNPGRGLLIGATLELFALETLPVGASRYPEWGSAAVVGGALFAQAPTLVAAMPAHQSGIEVAGAMCVAVLAAVATSWVGGLTMIWLRRLNGQLHRAQMPRLNAGSARSVVGLQLAGIGFDLLRGFALTVLALGVAGPALRAALTVWGSDARLSRAVVVALSGAVAAGAVWKLFHAVPRARWLLAGGLGLGFLVLVLR
jgi:PTS system mannose-specific IIC component